MNPTRILGFLLAAAALPLPAQTYTDMATALGWPSSSDSTRGMGWADYDGDGDADVYLQNQGSTSRLLRNDGTVFTNVTTAMAVSHASSGWSCAWGDFDGDGKPDLYLGNFQGNNLFRNNWPSPFTDVAAASGAADATFAQSVCWVDHDRDGDLDLYLTKELDPHRFFSNQGNGTFLDLTAQAGLADPQSHSYGTTWGDFDADGDQDCFVSTCGAGTVNRLFRNNQANGGGLLYTEIAAAAGVNYQPNTYGTGWVDLDDDGDLDLWVTGTAGEPNHLYRNDGTLPLPDVAAAAGVAGPPVNGRGVDFGDWDNDGRQDIFVHDSAGPSRLYRNLGGLVFAQVPGAAGAEGATGGGGYDCSFVDYDNDGRLDIHVATTARDRLFRSSGNANHWLKVALTGTRDNRSAIGAKVEVTAGGLTQHRLACNSAGAFSQNLLPVHFGLGSSTAATQVVVRWLDGTTDVRTNVAADQLLAIVQSSGGAAAVSAGAGCAPLAGPAPVLGTVGLPVLGNAAFALRVHSAPPLVPAALFLSTALAAAPLDAGNGCLIHLDLAGFLLYLQLGINPFASGATDAAGTFTLPLPLPPVHALAGLEFPLQALVLDPAGPVSGGVGPFTVTNALRVRLGH